MSKFRFRLKIFPNLTNPDINRFVTNSCSSSTGGLSGRRGYMKKIMKKARSLENSKFLTLQSTGDERIELPPKVLETPIIPFDQSPIYKKKWLLATNSFTLYSQNYIHAC